MAGFQAQGEGYRCLICNTGFKTENKVERLDVLFLLRILFKIPQDNELILKATNFVQVCEQCGNLIQECKLIYGTICEGIEQFWECQNKMLEVFSESTRKYIDEEEKETNSEDEEWFNRCRNFVKNHTFTGFGYPFVVHDLKSVLTLSPPQPPLAALFNLVNSQFKNDLHLHSVDNGSNPVSKDPEIEVKEELDSEADGENIEDKFSEFSDSGDDNDNDSDYEPSPSKKSKNNKPIIRNCAVIVEKLSPRKKRKTDSGSSNSKLTNCQVPEVEGNEVEDNFKRDPKTKKFHCNWPECTKEYVEKKSIIWHMDRHRGIPRRKCDHCDLVFFTMPQLRKHQELEHGNGVKFKCKTCGEEFPCKAKLHRHRTIKHSLNATYCKPAICEFCGKSIRQGNMGQHVERLHGGGLEKKFCCHLCPQRFEKGIALKMHLWRGHEFCESDEVRKQLEEIVKRRKEHEYKWKCRVRACGQRFFRQEGLKIHVEQKHGGDDEEDGGGEGKMKCELCGRGFHTRRRLLGHLEGHEKEMGKREGRWICVICGHVHGTEKGLEGHMDKVHKGEEVKPRPVKCGMCTKRFKSKRNLCNHRKQVHCKVVKE